MKTLLTEAQLSEGIRQLAEKIQAHYEGKPLTIVGVLIGSIVLLADLIRRLEMPIRVELVQARSYHNGTKPGPLVLNTDLLSSDIRGRDVLLVDDIFDTGHTLWELIPQIDELGPSEPARRGAAVEARPCGGELAARLRGLRDPRRLRRRLRPRLSRPLPEPALRRRAGAGRHDLTERVGG